MDLKLPTRPATRSDPGPGRPAAGGRRWRLFKPRRTSHGQLAILSAPGVLYILIFSYIPMFGIIVAFENFEYPKGILGSPLNGLQNFRFFFGSSEFVQIVRNTVLYNMAFILFGTALSIGIAVSMFLVRHHRRLVRLYQYILFLPYFLSFIIVAVIVNEFLSYQYGFVTHTIESLGGGHPNFYADARIWIIILIAVELWQGMGFSSLLYYTGLLGIDPTYYESAEVDGASRWQIVRHILLPTMSPLIGILMILAVGGLVNANFALFYFVPQNSPLLYPTTNVINTFVFNALIGQGEIGLPAAVGLFQSVVGLLLVVMTNLVVRRVNPDAALF